MQAHSTRAFRASLLGLVLALVVVSACAPPFHGYFWLEHGLTFALLGFMVALEFAGAPLSNRASCFLGAYMLLHMVGAHYTYTHVPYDQWWQALTGHTLGSQFGWTRNHYDRLIHFSFGLLLLVPMRELVWRFVGVRGRASVIVAASFLAVISGLYEILEWLIAATLSGAAAESYNGQQGDQFDAQKDMALAMLGLTITGVVLTWSSSWRGAVQASRIQPHTAPKGGKLRLPVGAPATRSQA